MENKNKINDNYNGMKGTDEYTKTGKNAKDGCGKKGTCSTETKNGKNAQNSNETYQNKN